MVTVQDVVYDHILQMLTVRDRDQILIHASGDIIVASVAAYPFMRIVFAPERVHIAALIPRAIPVDEGCLTAMHVEPVPRNIKNRKKWRRRINATKIYGPLPACPHIVFDLCDPFSIHAIEYMSNHIITTMIYLLSRRKRVSLRLRNGISHDLNLIEKARAAFVNANLKNGRRV